MSATNTLVGLCILFVMSNSRSNIINTNGMPDHVAGLKGEWKTLKHHNNVYNYQMISGRRVYQGDIVLPYGFGDNEVTSTRRRLNPYYTDEWDMWEDGIVPWTIREEDESKEHFYDKIRTAQKTIENVSPDITFVKRTNERDYIEFIHEDGCWSEMGRSWGKQQLSADNGCDAGIVVHELLHALGFGHTQTREDRDNYITILWDNIEDDHKHNYDKTGGYWVDDCLGYDFKSIMQYGKYYWSKNGKPTMDAVDPDQAILTWHPAAMSVTDKHCLKAVYSRCQVFLFNGATVNVHDQRHGPYGVGKFKSSKLIEMDDTYRDNTISSFQIKVQKYSKCRIMFFGGNEFDGWVSNTIVDNSFHNKSQIFNYSTNDLLPNGFIDNELSSMSIDVYYEFTTIKSYGGLCLSVLKNEYAKNGAAIEVYSCDNDDRKNKELRWYYNSTSNEIVNAGNGFCLDVHAPHYEDQRNGAKVQLHECNGWKNQKWIFDGSLIKSLNGLCLDVHAPDLHNNGAKVQLWQCIGLLMPVTQQRWIYHDYDLSENQKIKVRPFSLKNNEIGWLKDSSVSKTGIDCSDQGERRKWRVIWHSLNWIKLKNIKYGECLYDNLDDNYMSTGNNECNEQYALWDISVNNNLNKFQLKNAVTKRCPNFNNLLCNSDAISMGTDCSNAEVIFELMEDSVAIEYAQIAKELSITNENHYIHQFIAKNISFVLFALAIIVVLISIYIIILILNTNCKHKNYEIITIIHELYDLVFN